MVKICRIGTVPVGWDIRRASLYIKIILPKAGNLFTDDRSQYSSTLPRQNYLSIMGVIGALPSGNSRGGCGQINMEFAHRNPADNDKRYANPIKPSVINFAKGWNAEKWYDLLDIWKKYHMQTTNTIPIAVKTFLVNLPDGDKKPAWI
jgi:hypothetical protein